MRLAARDEPLSVDSAHRVVVMADRGGAWAAVLEDPLVPHRVCRGAVLVDEVEGEVGDNVQGAGAGAPDPVGPALLHSLPNRVATRMGFSRGEEGRRCEH